MYVPIDSLWRLSQELFGLIIIIGFSALVSYFLIPDNSGAYHNPLKQKTMKKIGIWMDKEKAHVVSLEGKKESFRTIASDVEFYNPKGGSRSRTQWGPQEVVQDSRYLEREKHQMRDYFGKLAKAVSKADVVSVFGPAEVKDKFAKEVKEKYPNLAAKLKAVETADSMTDNQVVAMVKEHYGWERPQ